MAILRYPVLKWLGGESILAAAMNQTRSLVPGPKELLRCIYCESLAFSRASQMTVVGLESIKFCGFCSIDSVMEKQRKPHASLY
ncbi:hypothetical protein VNO77_26913 [Canavalia gladiata]|uniref:Uncharacterized protein n=1 Tax=Canavalia gladiata TaxID=3824 RepID=A0AAN9KUV6_CANGL